MQKSERQRGGTGGVILPRTHNDDVDDIYRRILHGRASLNTDTPLARGNNIAVLLLLQWRVAALLKRTMPAAFLLCARVFILGVVNTFAFLLGLSF